MTETEGSVWPDVTLDEAKRDEALRVAKHESVEVVRFIVRLPMCLMCTPVLIMLWGLEGAHHLRVLGQMWRGENS